MRSLLCSQASTMGVNGIALRVLDLISAIQVASANIKSDWAAENGEMRPIGAGPYACNEHCVTRPQRHSSSVRAIKRNLARVFGLVYWQVRETLQEIASLCPRTVIMRETLQKAIHQFCLDEILFCAVRVAVEVALQELVVRLVVQACILRPQCRQVCNLQNVTEGKVVGQCAFGIASTCEVYKSLGQRLHFHVEAPHCGTRRGCARGCRARCGRGRGRFASLVAVAWRALAIAVEAADRTGI
mmetsp:Transcript_3719/g.6142  ORF Transcript_3719/g.6142 Transcript_3719/m.6142 type:complete len:243 (+) Transcript_3719:354-1082(+)